MTGSADTVLLPITNGDVPFADGKWLYLAAKANDDGFDASMRNRFVCEQPVRGPFLELQMRGMDVHPLVEPRENFSGALILIGKHRAENEAMIARASRMVTNGAPLIIAGDKTSGVVPLRKRLTAAVEIDGSLAKYHATVFWLRNSPDLDGVLKVQKSSPQGFETAPGMFSPEKIDKGSALLAEFINADISGDIADFGAGWGYLAAKILSDAKPRSLHLYEAHWPSLQAAENNTKADDQAKTHFYWHDLTRETVGKKFDWIVMNPPFHTGRKTEPQLGEQFITAAAKSLKPKGALLMVANVALPYEKTLQQNFSKVYPMARRDGFKILKAVR